MRPPLARAALSAAAASGRHRAELRVHAVLVGVLGLHGQESAGADMEGDEDAPDAALVEAAKKLVGEMQPGGRRRDRALLAGVERLVVGAVALVRRAPSGDVGRQRHLAEALDRLVEESAGKGEAEHDLAALALLLDLGVEAHELAGGAFGGLAEADAVADSEALCRPREGAPALGAHALVQQHLDAGRGFAPRRADRAAAPG